MMPSSSAVTAMVLPLAMAALALVVELWRASKGQAGNWSATLLWTVGFPLLAMTGSARGWALSMPYTHYARLQLEQWQMGAPVAQSLPVVCGLLLAALVLLTLSSLGLLRGLKRPDKWGGR